MKKIATLFVRDQVTKLVTDTVTAGCEWVIAGEGVATRKLDGTCCMVRDGKLYKRYELRYTAISDVWQLKRIAPETFEPATDIDQETGKRQGWVPVSDGPEDKWHSEAWDTLTNGRAQAAPVQGTYELIGPKVQGNPEGMSKHELLRHASLLRYSDCPRDFAGLKAWLAEHDVEGIVWHHSDGRMVKIKGRDFGIKRRKV